MSKVNFIDGVSREKQTHQNRRIETKKKNRSRREKVKNRALPHYYWKDEKCVRMYRVYTEPEHEEEVFHYERQSRPVAYVDGKFYFNTFLVKVSDGTVVVPERTRRYSCGFEYVPVDKPYLERVDTHSVKKSHRKTAARRFRRKMNHNIKKICKEELIDEHNLSNSEKSLYKRDYDLWWEID